MKTKFFALLIALGFSLQAHAIVISKAYDFSPDLIGVFEKKVQWALKMREQLPHEFLAAAITDEIGMACEDGFPTPGGEGCKIIFTLSFDQVTVNLIKKSIPFGFGEGVVKKLATLDPATQASSDHVQFGSPFERLPGDATHYYCQSNQTESGYDWKCTLHVSEEFLPRQ